MLLRGEGSLKQSLLSLIACPKCQSGLEAHADHSEYAEIMDGTLSCAGCGSTFPITRGIPRMLTHALSADKKATADAFAYEWMHYSKLTEADKKEFLGWIWPLTTADFEDRVVLDAGCGKGRHVVLASQFQARAVVGIDLSNAVEAAFQNTRNLPNVHILQADILSLPFSRPFDLVYSIGVLHHLPFPKEGFCRLAEHVKVGGRISIWVYGKEGNLWIEKLVNPIRKNVTSKLPRFITRLISFFPATVLYLALKTLYRPAKNTPKLKRLLPYSDYLCYISDYTFVENFWNVFDQLVAPTAFYHSEQEVGDWFASAKITGVSISRHNNNSWRGTGLVPL
jgi:SAM-dependent methyltransferase